MISIRKRVTAKELVELKLGENARFYNVREVPQNTCYIYKGNEVVGSAVVSDQEVLFFLNFRTYEESQLRLRMLVDDQRIFWKVITGNGQGMSFCGNPETFWETMEEALAEPISVLPTSDTRLVSFRLTDITWGKLQTIESYLVGGKWADVEAVKGVMHSGMLFGLEI